MSSVIKTSSQSDLGAHSASTNQKKVPAPRSEMAETAASPNEGTMSIVWNAYGDYRSQPKPFIYLQSDATTLTWDIAAPGKSKGNAKMVGYGLNAKYPLATLIGQKNEPSNATNEDYSTIDEYVCASTDSRRGFSKALTFSGTNLDPEKVGATFEEQIFTLKFQRNQPHVYTCAFYETLTITKTFKINPSIKDEIQLGIFLPDVTNFRPPALAETTAIPQQTLTSIVYAEPSLITIAPVYLAGSSSLDRLLKVEPILGDVVSLGTLALVSLGAVALLAKRLLSGRAQVSQGTPTEPV